MNRHKLIPVLILFFSYLNCSVIVAGKNPDNNAVTFSVVGDVMQHDLQLESAYDSKCKCYDYMPVFAPVKTYLEKADVTIGNLETTLPGDKKKYSGYPEFGAPDSLVTALKHVGFDILTTANNHSMDKRKEGLKRTIQVLDKEGIAHLGTYASHAEYQKNRIFQFEKKGIKFALLNYTYGTNEIPVPKDVVVNLIDEKKIIEDIELARKINPDVIIVLYHFGGEYLREPDSFQKKYVDLAFREGADIVLGGHPHVLQKFEINPIKDKYGHTKNRLVIYSLGNFVSNQARRFTDGGIIFNFTVRRNEDDSLNIDTVSYVPVWVYVERKPEKVQFYVLPVEDYIKNDSKPKVAEIPMIRMKQFYDDTTLHLKESLEKTALTYKNKQ